MIPPKFVVTGTGRHGSRYLSVVLTASGAPTGHEVWWNSTGSVKLGNYLGDSSWLAAPHLAEFDGPIMHQVRDPLLVVNSLLAFPEPPREAEFRVRTLGKLRGSVPDRAIQTVLLWRRMCDALAIMRWRVEDLNGGVVLELLSRAGVLDVSTTAVVCALEQASTSENAHSSGEILGWDKLPPGPDRLALMRAAEKDGYL